MKLEIALLAGEESKKFLASLSTEIDRLEKALAKLSGNTAKAVESPETEADTAEEDDEDFKPATKKAAKKAATTFDDDEDEVEPEAPVVTADEDEEDDGDFPEAPAAPAKRGRKKKVTRGDANDACMAYAEKFGRPAVLEILKKKFKSTKIGDIPEEKYGEVVEAMQAAQ